jgi:hypothetical protein
MLQNVKKALANSEPSTHDPEGDISPPPLFLPSALIIIALAAVIRARRFDQDGVSLPDGRPPWVTLGGQGAPNEFHAEPGTN